MVRGPFGNFPADRHASDAQIFARAIVALHKDADRVGADFRFDLSRRRSDAAFELVADHSRAAADVAFFAGPPMRGIHAVESAFGFASKPLAIVSPTPPRFP